MKYLVVGSIAAVVLIGWLLLRDDGGSTLGLIGQRNGEQISVVASFYPLAFAAERIIGEQGTVVNIGRGRDPHDVRLSTRDVRMLHDADLVVLQGAGLEPWGHDLEEQLDAANVPVLLATANIDLRESHHADGEHGEGHEQHDEAAHESEEGEGDANADHDNGSEHADGEKAAEHAHGEFDPHTWLDPELFARSVEDIAEMLIAIDPERADTYELNARALQAELAALSEAYESGLSDCALDEVIVSHDAYGYVAERYGFETHAIAGVSTQDRPSATILSELKQEAQDGVGAILLEDNSVVAFGEMLSQETGLTTLAIDPIAYEIDDEDYLTRMRTNLNTFTAALQCHE